MDGGMVYQTCCVVSSGPAIEAMVDRAREITRRTFRTYADLESLRDWEAGQGYAGHPSHGLTCAADHHVRYFRSRYMGRPCVYIVHSAIEHIFLEPRL